MRDIFTDYLKAEIIALIGYYFYRLRCKKEEIRKHNKMIPKRYCNTDISLPIPITEYFFGGILANTKMSFTKSFVRLPNNNWFIERKKQLLRTSIPLLQFRFREIKIGLWSWISDPSNLRQV
jgi:hypothetical protein